MNAGISTLLISLPACAGGIPAWNRLVRSGIYVSIGRAGLLHSLGNRQGEAGEGGGRMPASVTCVALRITLQRRRARAAVWRCAWRGSVCLPVHRPPGRAIGGWSALTCNRPPWVLCVRCKARHGACMMPALSVKGRVLIPLQQAGSLAEQRIKAVLAVSTLLLCYPTDILDLVAALAICQPELAPQIDSQSTGDALSSCV